MRPRCRRYGYGFRGLGGRLRGELTSSIGRRPRSLPLVRQALGVARLVTLTGPGGSASPGWPRARSRSPVAGVPAV